MPDRGWEEALRRWAQAGLIPPDQAEAIRRFELATGDAPAAPAPPRGTEPPDRFTATEALVYGGAATILAGLAYLVASSTPTAGQAAISLIAGVAGLAAGWALATGQGPADLVGSGRRAAGVCLAAAIGLLGAGVCLTAIAAGWLVTTTTYCSSGTLTYCYTSTDRGEDVIAGAAVALVLGTIAFDRLRSSLLGLLTAAAVYTTGFAAVARADASGPTAYALVATVAGVWLLAVGFRGSEWREPMLFLALIVPLTNAFLTDGSSSVGLGGVLAGVAAASALALAVPLNSNGLAVAGGLGIFGFCVDVTVRSFGSTSPALVLIVGGLALVGSALLVQQAVRRRRPPSDGAGPAGALGQSGGASPRVGGGAGGLGPTAKSPGAGPPFN